MNEIDRYEYLKKKMELNSRHIKYLHSKGYSNFEIADHLISIMIEGLKQGIRMEHPEFNDEEINKKLKENIDNYEKLKKNRRKRL